MLNERDIAHHNLPGMGVDGQAKLAAARILCIGAGGLACVALLYLAAMGIGRIGIVDDDVVSLSNLPRQPLYTVADIGKPKVEIAQARLAALNPNIQIQIYQTRLTIENALELAADYDILLDCSDNFATKYLINAMALKTGKLWIYGAALGWQGQIATFIPGQTACYRCWLPEPPQAVVQNCSEAGVLGVLPGIIGAWQAQQVVQLILGNITQTVQLQLIETKQLRQQTLLLAPNPACLCQHNNIADLPLTAYIPQLVLGNCMINHIPYSEAAAMQHVLWIDIRDSEERENSRYIQAKHEINLSVDTLINGNPKTWPKQDGIKFIVIYCEKSGRSDDLIRRFDHIIEELAEHFGVPIENVFGLAGGYMAYQSAGQNFIPITAAAKNTGVDAPTV